MQDEVIRKARKHAFFICPSFQFQNSHEALTTLERDGWIVFCPQRDIPYDKTGGVKQYAQARDAMEKAQRVFLIWDGKDLDGIFYGAMAFALKKPLTVLACPPESLGIAFQNLFLEM